MIGIIDIFETRIKQTTLQQIAYNYKRQYPVNIHSKKSKKSKQCYI